MQSILILLKGRVLGIEWKPSKLGKWLKDFLNDYLHAVAFNCLGNPHSTYLKGGITFHLLPSGSSNCHIRPHQIMAKLTSGRPQLSKDSIHILRLYKGTQYIWKSKSSIRSKLENLAEANLVSRNKILLILLHAVHTGPSVC